MIESATEPIWRDSTAIVVIGPFPTIIGEGAERNRPPSLSALIVVIAPVPAARVISAGRGFHARVNEEEESRTEDVGTPPTVVSLFTLGYPAPAAETVTRETTVCITTAERVAAVPAVHKQQLGRAVLRVLLALLLTDLAQVPDVHPAVR